MSIASPETEEERQIAIAADQGYDAGWADALEAAAKLADAAEEEDQINYGAAASGAAYGLGDRIRALAYGQSS